MLMSSPLASQHLAARITSTGWRLVGQAAALLDQPRPLEPGDEEHCVFAARFRVKPWLASRDALQQAIGVLSQAIQRDLPEAPALTVHAPASVPAERSAGVSWRVTGDRGAFVGELLWRHPHAVRREVACTTHVVLEELPHVLTMTVRVHADGGPAALNGPIGVKQARPAFLSVLARECRLQASWGDVSPTILRADDIERFVTQVLLAERDWPVAVLSTLENGEYVEGPDAIADEMLGLARVFALDSQATSFELSDSVGGKHLSCYFGAMRVYMPHFSCADDPFDHPLLVADALADPFVRAQLIGTLALGMRHVSPPPPSVTDRSRARGADKRPLSSPVESEGAASVPREQLPASVLPTAVEAPPAPVVRPAGLGASPTEPGLPPSADMVALLVDLTTQLRGVAEAVASLAVANADLVGDVARLRTAHSVRQSGMASIERRLERLANDVRLGFDRLAPTPSLPADGGLGGEGASTDMVSGVNTDEDDAEDTERAPTLLEVLRRAAEMHPDALLILESAERAVAESPYEDVDRVTHVLDAMADIARRRQHGRLQMSVFQALRDVGIDYRSGIGDVTSERLRSQYVYCDGQGREFDCREHIALGGGTYDPRYVLRIYFTSRDPLDVRFVIGHVGRHHRVKTTT